MRWRARQKASKTRVIMHAMNDSLLNTDVSIEELLHNTFRVVYTQRETIDVLQTENARLVDENNRLNALLKLAQHQRFGKKSEIGEPILPEKPETVTIAAHTRKKKSNGRLMDFSLLPRHTVYHDLSEDKKTCTCCQKPLKPMGQDVSEQLQVIPQKLYVEEHVRYKYACTSCETVYMSPKEPAPIPKAMAGGSLLTEIVINKYQYHLPLYRQSKILTSYQANIPDNTLGNWVMQVGDALAPLYPILWEAILSARYLQVDETPITVLNPNKKGYLWAYHAPHLGNGLTVYEFNLTRKGAVAEERLAAYKGLLQTDGYNGYTTLRQRNDIEGFGCLTHARRKFHDVVKISKNKAGIAAEAIERLKPLYALEARMRDNAYSFHTRKRLRQRLALPILIEFKRWLKAIAPQVPPKSQLGTAIAYTFNQWPYLIKYCHHGMAEIDTNGVENKIRDIAIGKKNWLFMGNEDSGAVHALFYSLLISSVANNLNPRVYFHYLIMHVHAIRRKELDLAKLLPHNIDSKILEAFAQEQLDKTKNLLKIL